MGIPSGGCGVCKGSYRRIRCDQARPVCNRCSKSGRLCDGYGLRLSWPRNGRRRIVTQPRSGDLPGAEWGCVGFVHTTTWDVQVNETFTTNGWDSWHASQFYTSAIPALASPVAWIPHALEASDKDLIQYFESISSNSLTTLGKSISDLRSTLIRTALSSNTPSAAAVLQALLALSSLHRYGLHRQTARYKLSALKLLQQSTSGVLGTTEYVQNSAAGMLLCSFEIHKSDETSGHWIWYVCGSKDIMAKASRDRLAWDDGDFIVILGWVHYHDVLAKFSLRHWRHHGVDERDYTRDAGFTGQITNTCHIAKVPFPPGPPHEMLNLLLQVCERIVDPSEPSYSSTDSQNFALILEWKLGQVLRRHRDSVSLPAADAATSKIVELHQVAAMVYLLRLSDCLDDRATKIHQLVDAGFDMLRALGTCPWPFPLLILGCEARSDQGRVEILQLIHQTEKVAYARNLHCVNDMLRLSWVHQDLAVNKWQYANMMSSTFSTSDIVPTFV